MAQNTVFRVHLLNTTPFFVEATKVSPDCGDGVIRLLGSDGVIAAFPAAKVCEIVLESARRETAEQSQ